MRAIFNFFTLHSIYKFANKQGFINRLNHLGASEDIIEYTQSLDDKLCGVVVGAVAKNKSITLDEIKSLVAKKERVEALKAETAKAIESDLGVEGARLKEWATIQVKKDSKNRALILDNVNRITSFLNDHDVDLASYDVQSLLDYIDQFERFGETDSQDMVDQYITKSLDHANSILKTINNPPLVNWAKRKFISIAGEWRKKIKKVVVQTPFQQLMADAAKMKQDIDDGLYRGRELPDTPLRNGEYDTLTSNLEFLDDWHKATRVNISDFSVADAVKASNDWHKEMAASGIGLTYKPINRADIVYGPDNWENEENKGFIILELKDENDLKVEGAKQSHCVGGYGEKIKKKECRIFSLRNVNDVYNPILTIETDISGAIVRQDNGYGNKKIDQKYHDMVTEWASKNEIDVDNIQTHEIDKIRNSKTLSAIVDKTDDEYTLRLVAQNPATNAETLSAIVAKTDDIGVLANVVQSPAVNTEILSTIIDKNDDTDILANVAQSPAANAEMLSAIVAKNDDTPLLILVAENPAANAETLSAIIAKNNTLRVLNPVAQNPAANAEILSAIRKKLTDIVAKIDSRHELGRHALELVTRNPAADAEVLSAIVAKTNSAYVLELVAQNPAADAEVLSAIVAKPNHLGVLGDVVQNPAANAEILSAIRKKLTDIVAKTNDVDTLQAVAESSAADADILLAIVNKANDLNTLWSVTINSAVNTEALSIIVDKINNPLILEPIARRHSTNDVIIQKIKDKIGRDPLLMRNEASSYNIKINNIYKYASKYYSLSKYLNDN